MDSLLLYQRQNQYIMMDRLLAANAQLAANATSTQPLLTNQGIGYPPDSNATGNNNYCHI